MSSEEPDLRPETSGAPPEAETRTPRGLRRISPIWLIPLVAAAVGAGLAYRTLTQEGPTIEITFETAEGLEAGKTTVRLLSVAVGTVTEIDVSPDVSHVVVKAKMSTGVAPSLTESARFWVVRPRITSAGVSGLSTLVSGSYIALEPGKIGERRVNRFEGLAEPPIDPMGKKGLHLELVADTLGGLGEGSPIYYRDLTVGSIDSYQLAKDGDEVVLNAFIEARYASLVHENTRFSNTSGIDVSASLSKGFDIDVESLRSLLAGGVSFETPGNAGAPAKDGARFRLHTHAIADQTAAVGHPGPRFVVEAPLLGSIKPGDPVLYREETVGRVVSHALHDEARSVGILIEIDAEYAPLVRANSVFWNASGVRAHLGLRGLDVDTESLESLVEGGVAFGTPGAPGPRAAAGSVFALADKPPKHWKDWQPRIWLGAPGKDPEAGDAKAEPKPVLVHHKPEALEKSGAHHWFRKLFR